MCTIRLIRPETHKYCLKYFFCDESEENTREIIWYVRVSSKRGKMKPTKCSFYSSFNIWFCLSLSSLRYNVFFLVDTHKIFTFYLRSFNSVWLDYIIFGRTFWRIVWTTKTDILNLDNLSLYNSCERVWNRWFRNIFALFLVWTEANDFTMQCVIVQLNLNPTMREHQNSVFEWRKAR